MKLNLSVLFTLSLFALFLCLPQIQAQGDKGTESSPKVISLPFRETIDHNARYFAIDISKFPNAAVDIGISSVPIVRKGKKTKSPDIFVSKTKVPTNKESSEFSANKETGNLIIIPRTKAGDNLLYVSIICPEKPLCYSNVTVEYIQRMAITANEPKRTFLGGSLGDATSTIMRLKVPKVENANRIVIHIDAMGMKKGENPELDVFINKGNEVPFTNNAERIERIHWFSGTTLVIHDDNKIFCTDCNYTMSLRFTKNSTISMEAFVYKKNMELKTDAVLDGVKEGKYNQYTFQVLETHREEDFVLSIIPQQGKPKVYINCDFLPNDYRTSYWNYNVDSAEEITLTPREHSRCESERYYLTIDSEESSVYSLKASYNDNHRLIIGRSNPVIGDLFANEKVSYDIIVPLFAVDQIDIKLITKQNISVRIMPCRFPADCPNIIPSDMESKYPGVLPFEGYNSNAFNYTISNISEFGKRILMNPHKSGCYPILVKDSTFNNEAIPVCGYRLTLKNHEINAAEYKLLANSVGHQWIFPGRSKSDSVDQKGTRYYVLYVPQQDAESVEIQLTLFSGDVNVFVSRTVPYPKPDTDDTEFSHEGFLLFKKKPNQNLNGYYYIGVFGSLSSSYSISTFVNSASGAPQDYALTLEEGVPQRGVLLTNKEHPVQFYKIELSRYASWEGSIQININTFRGNVILAVNSNDEVPMPNGDHQWKTKGNTLEISSSDDNFVRQGTYHIGVFVDWENTVEQSIEEITFNIRYFVNEGRNGNQQPGGSSYIYLSPLSPHRGFIRKGETQYFEIEIQRADFGFTIYKQTDVGDIDLYLSLDRDERYPGENSYDYSTKNSYKNYLQVTTKDIWDACDMRIPGTCSLHMAVVLSGNYPETHYTLSIKKDTREKDQTIQAPIALENGIQLIYSVPQKNNPAVFYYYAGTEHSVVTITSIGKEITIYALKKNIEVGSSLKFNSNPPSEKLYDYSSLQGQNFGHGHSHITIPPGDEGKTTVIMLAVYFRDPALPDNFDYNSTKNKNKQEFAFFTILLSSQIFHLFTGYPYYGAILKDTYSYFYINVYQPQCTLLITLTTLDDGDPDLIVSFGAEERPTIQDHQFASISRTKAEVLEINNLDIYPRDSMVGTWVIGVYGNKDSAYTLTVVYEDDKMVDLSIGVPFEMFLKQDHKMYFKFYQERKSTLKVKLDLFSGVVNGYVTVLKDNQDLASNLPNSTYHNWRIKSDDTKALTIAPGDAKFCSKCLYVIALEASVASKFSIIVTEGESRFTQIQSGLTYADHLPEKSKKTFVFSGRNVEEASLNVYLTGTQLKVYASHNPVVNSSQWIWIGDLSSTRPTITMTLSKEDAKEKYKPYIWDGERNVPSENNSFYVQFENPTIYPVDFSFTAITKEGNTILKAGIPHISVVDNYGRSNYLFYYSAEGDTLKFIIEYSLREHNYDLEFTRPLGQGIPVLAQYFSERATAGLGEYVLLNTEQIVPHYVDHEGKNAYYTFTQVVTAVSRSGKFSFEIENPYNAQLNLEVKVISNAVSVIKMDQDSQHSSVLTPGKSEALEINIGFSGKWYLSVLACEGSIALNIIDGQSQAQIPLLGDAPNSLGKDYLYTSSVEASTQKLVKVSNSAASNSHFLVSSAQFHEKKLYDFEPKMTSFPVNSEYLYDRKGSTLVVKIKRLELSKDLDPTDEISYHVRVCPESEQASKYNLCTLKGDCRLGHEKVRVNNGKDAEVKVAKVRDGKYYIQTTAYIQHGGKMVRMVPYDVIDVEVKEPLGNQVKDMSGKIILGIIACIIAIVICIKCYKKIEEKFGDQGGFVELQMFKKKKGYNVLGEE